MGGWGRSQRRWQGSKEMRVRDPGERHSTRRGPAKGPGCESTQVQTSGVSGGVGESSWLSWDS